MMSPIIQALFEIKIQPIISEQEKKQQKIYDLLNTETKPKFLCQLYTRKRIFFLTKKELFKENGGVEDSTKKRKKMAFNCYGD